MTTPRDPHRDPHTDPHGIPAVPGPHDVGDIGALALGLIGGPEAARVQAHLDTCPACRTEYLSLRRTAEAVAEIPPEMFLEGPPDSDLLVRRALRTIAPAAPARPVTPMRRPHRFARVLGAAAAAAVLLGGGLVLGRATAPPPEIVAAPAGAVTASGTSEAPGGGTIAMTTTVTPARGWVRVGLSVRGIPPDLHCTIIVVDENGDEHVAGEWITSPGGETDGTELDGAAAVDPEDVTGVVVRDADGHDLITVAV